MHLGYAYTAAVSNVVIHLNILLADRHVFFLSFGELITHTEHDITAGVRGI